MYVDEKWIQFGKKSWTNMPFHYIVPSPSIDLFCTLLLLCHPFQKIAYLKRSLTFVNSFAQSRILSNQKSWTFEFECFKFVRHLELSFVLYILMSFCHPFQKIVNLKRFLSFFDLAQSRPLSKQKRLKMFTVHINLNVFSFLWTVCGKILQQSIFFVAFWSLWWITWGWAQWNYHQCPSL